MLEQIWQFVLLTDIIIARDGIVLSCTRFTDQPIKSFQWPHVGSVEQRIGEECQSRLVCVFLMEAEHNVMYDHINTHRVWKIVNTVRIVPDLSRVARELSNLSLMETGWLSWLWKWTMVHSGALEDL
jgi:hypothetical protein